MCTYREIFCPLSSLLKYYPHSGSWNSRLYLAFVLPVSVRGLLKRLINPYTLVGGELFETRVDKIPPPPRHWWPVSSTMLDFWGFSTQDANFSNLANIARIGWGGWAQQDPWVICEGERWMSKKWLGNNRRVIFENAQTSHISHVVSIESPMILRNCWLRCPSQWCQVV
jgi:hypothetical protein